MPCGYDFLNALEKKAKMYASSARATYEANEEICNWLFDPLARWAHAAYGNGVFEYAVRGYVEYCMNVAREQQRYEKEGTYQPHSLSEITDSVYNKKAVMTPYMWAAILIYGFWKSMTNHLKLFKEQFLDVMPYKSELIEFACGHGVLGLISIEHRPDLQLRGYDISSSAILIANKLASASGHSDSVEFIVQDILNLNVEEDKYRYDGVIAAMLAEHLEDPARLFASINYVLKPGGKAFLSTAIESAQPDHLYEFNYESEPICMAERFGLRICRVVCDSASKSEGARYNPRALAMVLEKTEPKNS